LPPSTDVAVQRTAFGQSRMDPRKPRQSIYFVSLYVDKPAIEEAMGLNAAMQAGVFDPSLGLREFAKPLARGLCQKGGAVPSHTINSRHQAFVHGHIKTDGFSG